MQRKNRLWTRWCRIYAGQIAVIQMIMYLSLVIGKFICENMNRIWYEDNQTYIFLKWIEVHQWGILCFVLLVSAVLLTFYRFWKVENRINEIQSAVDYLYENKEENISLAMELVKLENSLNELRLKMKADTQAAKDANQRKNELIMYMAHDLKTPLTSVIGYLTLVCEEKEIPWDVKEKYMNIALRKSHRLEELTNEFFDITRFNFSHMILEKSSVNISVMIRQIVSEFMTEFAKKGLAAECEIEPDCLLFCDTDKMERVFDNIFKNIINYSYNNTKIKIILRKIKQNQLEIITENRGKTIPKEMQEHIFEQFFRMDSARNSETGGSGLGLAVAKEILILHGGTISCTSENEVIVFRMLLPLCQP